LSIVVFCIETAERWEPYESRGSRTVLRKPEGEVPLGYSAGESAGQPVLLPGSRPLAAPLVFKGHFLSKFNVLPEFIEHLPAATELGVGYNKNGEM